MNLYQSIRVRKLKLRNKKMQIVKGQINMGLDFDSFKEVSWFWVDIFYTFKDLLKNQYFMYAHRKLS